MTLSIYAVGMAVLGMACFQFVMPGIGRPVASQAGSQEQPARLDSRIIPHPDWVQVSGQIEETVRMKPDGQSDQLIAMLQPVEGGRIAVDLGPADQLTTVRLEPRDHIHVRGPVLKNGNMRTVIAGEIIAEGKVITIERAAGHAPPVTAPADGETGHMRLSPAAPAVQAPEISSPGTLQ